jgi:DNA-binding transcriptional MerR regulator
MPGVQRYRIDELARVSGVTVRNIRYYQDRGMLPPPSREGRVALYGETHLARLRLITRLLERHYTTANIVELLSAWEQGRDLSAILGLEQVVTANLSHEPPELITATELGRVLQAPEPELLDLVGQACEWGIVERTDEQTYRLPNPGLLQATISLVAAGTPPQVALRLVGQIREALDSAISTFMPALAEGILAGRDEDWMPADTEVADLTALVGQIKPLIAATASAAVTQSVAQHLDEVFGRYLARVMPNVALGRTPASSSEAG